MHLSSDDGTSHPGLDLNKYCELLNEAATVLGNSHQPTFIISEEGRLLTLD